MSDGFVFYRSFYEAIKNLNADDYKKCVNSLCEYAMNGNYDPDGAVASMFLTMAKPQIDANMARRRNGAKGGRPVAEKKKKPRTEMVEEPLADVEAIPLNDGTEWRPTESMFVEYLRLFPNVDVKREFANMRSWSLSNSRKTVKGVKRFVNGWLSREQNRPHGSERTVQVVPMPSLFYENKETDNGDDEDLITEIKNLQKGMH